MTADRHADHMSPCRAFAAELLEASPAELRSLEGPVALHLADCDACREAAAAILAGYEEIARALDTHPPIDAASVVAEALGAAAAPAEASSGTPVSSSGAPAIPPARWWHPSTPSRRARGRTVSPLALLAAAVLAALLLLPIPDRPGQALGDMEPVVRRPIVTPLVESFDGTQVAVLPTRNPDITVMWFYAQESAP